MDTSTSDVPHSGETGGEHQKLSISSRTSSGKPSHGQAARQPDNSSDLDLQAVSAHREVMVSTIPSLQLHLCYLLFKRLFEAFRICFQLDISPNSRNNVFMRTTIDLPDDLFKELKAASALRGASLKQTIREALVQYRNAGCGVEGEFKRKRVNLPLVGRPGGARHRLSGGDLEQALAESENLRVDA